MCEKDIGYFEHFHQVFGKQLPLSDIRRGFVIFLQGIEYILF